MRTIRNVVTVWAWHRVLDVGGENGKAQATPRLNLDLD